MHADRLSPAELLDAAVFQVFLGDRFAGSGFLVGDRLGVTCAHVVSTRQLRVRYREAWLPATLLSTHPPEPGEDALYPLPDLAFLEIGIAVGHPTVLLSRHTPRPGSRLFGLGFAVDDGPGGGWPQPHGVLAEVTGPAAEAVRLRGDQIVPGLSGSPLLDLDEGRVCAILKTSRHVREVRGGWAVPIRLAEVCRPGLLSVNATRHPPGTPWRDAADQRSEATRALFATTRPNAPSARPSDPPPSWWLNPRNRTVDYVRPALYGDLLAWCRDPAPSYAVRLVVAPGGVGKTRLALELREQLAADGWIAGLVSLGADVRRIAAALPEAAERHRVFMSVDYAETLRPELDELLHAVDRCPAGSVRVLLLARSTGPWWPHLLGPTTHRLLVDSAEGRLDGDLGQVPVAVVEAAYRTFRAEVPGADTDAPSELPPSLRERAASQQQMLDLHAIALVGVLGGDAVDPLADVLGHELHYAMRMLDTRAQVPSGADDSVVQRLTLAPTLVTVEDRDQAVSLVERLAVPLRRAFAAPESVAVVLAGLYPPESPDAYWGQLRPDRLAEHLLRDVAASFGSVRSVSDYLRAALGAASPSRAIPIVTVIFRAALPAGHSPVDLIEVLRQMVADNPPTIAPAVLAASVTSDDAASLIDLVRAELNSADLATVQAISDHLPANFRDVSDYASFGVAVLRRLDELLEADGYAPSAPRRGDNFHDLALALKSAGNADEAIEWFVRARDGFASATLADPAAFLRKRASAVNGIGLCLSDLGQHRQATDAFAEAATVCRRAIAAKDSLSARDTLAMILGNLSHGLLAQGRHTAALEPGRESVATRRALAEQEPAYRPGLVRSLTKLADVMNANERPHEAVDLAREAVEVAEGLGSRTNPTAAQITASALGSLGECLDRLGDHDAAVGRLTEAADLLVRLADIRGDPHIEEVALTLTNLAATLAARDRLEEARGRIEQAHRLARKAASRDLGLARFYVHVVARCAELLLVVGDVREAYELSAWAFDRSELPLPGAAMPQTPAYAALVHGNVLFEAQGAEEALVVVDEAVARYRRIAGALDGAFRGDLARALLEKQKIESVLGDHEAAMAAGEEAVDIWNGLRADGAGGFDDGLLQALTFATRNQLALGRTEDAIDTATRAVELLTGLAGTEPLRHGAALAVAWTELGLAYSSGGRGREALHASLEAVRTIETFIIGGGDDGERVYAKCLRNLSCDLADAGYGAQAVAASRRANELLKALPDWTGADLVERRGVLTNLVKQCRAVGDHDGAYAAEKEVKYVDRLLGRPWPT
ncbi:tetratricopeptide repeat protein [Micromonospora endolithica]|nr:tetratricopeptide repeat protein [Micromonospora endolithica]TWJ21159.1 tetratricopeptide repeat protein [Micromonospora endolithica]